MDLKEIPRQYPCPHSNEGLSPRLSSNNFQHLAMTEETGYNATNDVAIILQMLGEKSTPNS